jgi:RsmE family RNA methyltransferase
MKSLCSHIFINILMTLMMLTRTRTTTGMILRRTTTCRRCFCFTAQQQQQHTYHRGGFLLGPTLNGLLRQQQRQQQHVSPTESILTVTTRRTISSSSTTLLSTSNDNNLPIIDYDDRQQLQQETKHLPRLYVKNAVFAKQSTAPLTNSQVHYLVDVMRISNPKRWGTEHQGRVRIFGDGEEWLAKLIVLDAEGGTKKKKRKKGNNKNNDGISSAAVLECLEPIVVLPNQSASAKVNLYVGRLKKKEQRRWMLEKVTELGIDSIGMVQTEYTMFDSTDDDDYDDDYQKHKSYIIEASEQCERCNIPSLSPSTVLLNEILDKTSDADKDGDDTTVNHHWLICRERSQSSPPILSVLQSIDNVTKNRNSVVVYNILIGPEGGWSPNEIEMFTNIIENNNQQQQQSRTTFHFVSLGPLILRAETAAVAAVSAVKFHNDIVTV